MLGKLLKHEFRATGRIMWVLYAAMLALSLGSHFAMRYMDEPHSALILRILATLVTVLWVLALMFGAVMTVVLMVQRFYKNFLTDEGYLMFTLPTGIPSMIFSKLIVSVVWVIVTILVMLLGVCLAVADSSLLQAAADFLREGIRMASAEVTFNVAAMLLEIALVVIVGMACSMLEFYAAMSLGYGFTGHKALWSVVSYFVISVVFQLIGSVMLVAMPGGMIRWFSSLEPMQGFHVTMCFAAAAELAAGAALYVVTWLNLKKRLNLA